MSLNRDDLLQQAIDRIKDMLLEDDGQAFKEARKFIERVERIAAHQPQAQEPSKPDSGACPGDGSICPNECRLAAESPTMSDVVTWLERTMRCGVPEVEQAARACYAFYQGAEFPEPVSGAVDCWISWDEKNVHGDRKSIEAVRAALHAAGTVPALQEIIRNNSRAQQAPAQRDNQIELETLSHGLHLANSRIEQLQAQIDNARKLKIAKLLQRN